MVPVDNFGREVTGVRISLTDRCNLDCVHCHNEGLGDTRGPVDASDEEMSADDVIRSLEVVEEYGVEKVKFTGGEPTPRADLEEIIRRTPDSVETSLTTNGTLLGDRAEGLVVAGLDRMNVSQNALDPETFAQITKSGVYDKVTEGVKAAVDAGLTPVKLNMVVFTKIAGHVEGMVEYVAENPGLQLQLIQYMPELTGEPEWNVDIERIHRWLTDFAGEVKVRDMHHHRRYYVGEGMVEIVDPVENPEFCANCHRVRVTHEGYLKGCLNRNDDLHPMGEVTREDIYETFEAVAENRVPYYGEYLIRDGNDGWMINEEYIGA